MSTTPTRMLESIVTLQRQLLHLHDIPDMQERMDEVDSMEIDPTMLLPEWLSIVFRTLQSTADQVGVAAIADAPAEGPAEGALPKNGQR